MTTSQGLSSFLTFTFRILPIKAALIQYVAASVISFLHYLFIYLQYLIINPKP